MNDPRIHFYKGSAFPDYKLAKALQDPREAAPESERPDARIFALDDDGFTVGFLALWWKETPEYEGNHVGAIGGFAALNETIAKALLDEAVAQLEGLGAKMIVGPMNGNTWRRYRFVIESNDRGPFLLEPRNPIDYVDWWKAAGFSQLSGYSSSAIELNGEPTIQPALKERLMRSGVTIRALDLSNYEAELRAIHAISLKSFASNFLYTPLDEDAFVGAYLKLKDRVDPEMVRIAERDALPCGFVFAVADLEAASRGEKPALIIKTLAVDPGSRCAGLGNILVDEVQIMAFRRGFTTALHALQYDHNNNLRMTKRQHGQVFRRYGLFTKLR